MVNNRTYHIIGAGIAGLYAAKLIKEKNPLSTIIIYEASEKIGGRCGGYFDNDFNCNCDNATHVILNCNKNALSIIGKNNFSNSISFVNYSNNKFIPKLSCIKESLWAIFNTSSPNFRALFFVIKKLFPFINIKAYFSEGDLVDKLCYPLLVYANSIEYGYIWKNIEYHNHHINKLIFNKKTIDIAPNDIVISAIDSLHYNHIFGEYDFEYNTITNIFYRTSMALTLPNNLKMLGLKNSLCHWLFSSQNYTAITVSDAKKDIDPRICWNEICNIRNYNSAFLPEYKKRVFHYATIKQDKKNNCKRPTSAKTKFDNLFICGDWTMKNQPCCIETAIMSAKRLKKYI